MVANGPGDLGSIPGRVIPKTQKMILDATLLNTQHYKVRIKGKVEQSRKRSNAPPTCWCSSYRKRSLRVTLNYSRQLYSFNVITLRSTLARSVSTCLGPIYGSNRFACNLFVLDIKTWYHTTMCQSTAKKKKKIENFQESAAKILLDIA